MPFYKTTEQFYQSFGMLFKEIVVQHPEATQAIYHTGLVIRLCCSEPTGIITLNGQQNPVNVTFGDSDLNPDIVVSAPANTLHKIFSDELSLRKTVATGEVQVKGSVFKAFALTDVFKTGRTIYPQVLQTLGFSAT